MNRVTMYLKDVRAELAKVSWPTRQQTVNYTLVVLGLSFTLAIFLGVLDFGLAELVDRFIIR